MFWSIAQVVGDLITKKIVARYKRLELESLLYKSGLSNEKLLDQKGNLTAKATKLLASKNLLIYKYKDHNHYFNVESGKWNAFSSKLTLTGEVNVLKEYEKLTNHSKTQKSFFDIAWKYVYRKIKSKVRSILLPGDLQTLYWFKKDFLTEKAEAKFNSLIYPWYSKLPKPIKLYINKNNSVWSNQNVYKKLEDVVQYSKNSEEYEKNIENFITQNRSKLKKMFRDQTKKKIENWDKLKPEEKKALNEIAKQDKKGSMYNVPIKLLWIRITPETGGKMKGRLPTNARYNLSNQECPIKFRSVSKLYSSKIYNLEVPPGIENTSTRTLIITLSGKSFESRITSIRWA